MEEGLLYAARYLENVFESGLFFDDCYLDFIYGDDEDKMEELYFNGERMQLRHSGDEARGCFLVDVHYDKSRLRWKKMNRFFNAVFGIKSPGGSEFWVEYIKVPVVRGGESITFGTQAWESIGIDAYYTLQHQPKNVGHYVHFLCQVMQELVPPGDVFKYIHALGDEVWDYFVSEMTYRYCKDLRLNGGFYSVSNKHSQITDELRNYKFSDTFVINPAKATGCLHVNRKGSLQKQKSDQKNLDKTTFNKLLNDFLGRTDITFNIYECRGDVYSLFIVYDQTLIINDLEYVVVMTRSCISKSTARDVALTIKPITFAGYSDSSAMYHFEAAQPIEYTMKWEGMVLDEMDKL